VIPEASTPNRCYSYYFPVSIVDTLVIKTAGKFSR